MSKTVNIEGSGVTILLEIDGIVHLVAMEKEKYKAIKALIKASTTNVSPTKIHQENLKRILLEGDSN